MTQPKHVFNDYSACLIAIDKAERECYDAMSKRNTNKAADHLDKIIAAATEAKKLIGHGPLIGEKPAATKDSTPISGETAVPVARWDAYKIGEPSMSHSIKLEDRRGAGQLMIAVPRLDEKGVEVDSPEVLGVTVEVQNLAEMFKAERMESTPRQGVDVPVVHLHFNESALAGSFFHEVLPNGRSRFIFRPETGVAIRGIGRGLQEITSPAC